MTASRSARKAAPFRPRMQRVPGIRGTSYEVSPLCHGSHDVPKGPDIECVEPPDLGTRELATSQPAQTARPTMATAVVDRQPAMRHVDPVLNQKAGLGLDDGLVHGGVPFRVRSLRRAPSWASCHLFNEHLCVNSTLEARFSTVTSGLPVH